MILLSCSALAGILPDMIWSAWVRAAARSRSRTISQAMGKQKIIHKTTVKSMVDILSEKL